MSNVQVELPANSKMEYKYVILEEQVLFFADFDASTRISNETCQNTCYTGSDWGTFSPINS